jgi:uncharacterized membrane protein YedE/YeeE
LALRYTMDYYKIFRYSAFVLTTVLIRISLSLPSYFNVILGIVAAVFLVCTSLAYNFFIRSLREVSYRYWRGIRVRLGDKQ